MRFDTNILMNRQTHLVNDIRLEFLERHILQNIVQLVQSLEHLYLVLLTDIWHRNECLSSFRCQIVNLINIIPIDAANYVARFGIPQNVENIGKGKKS